MRLTDKQKRVLLDVSDLKTVRLVNFHPCTKRDNETAYVMEEKGLIYRIGYALTAEGERVFAKLKEKD
jgi:hypothetical protein